MFVCVIHCDNEQIYMNSNCRVGILKQYLIKKCPPIVPSRAVDLIDTSGSLIYLSWFPNHENAMSLFRPFHTYLLVYLIAIPKVEEAVRIVPTLKNYWKVYPEVRDKISKPMLLQVQTATPSAASTSTITTPSSAMPTAMSLLNKLKPDTHKKEVKTTTTLLKKMNFKKS